jgi:hypothetical protein
MSWQRVLWHQRHLLLVAALTPMTFPSTRWITRRFLGQVVATRNPVVVASQMGEVASPALAPHVRVATPCHMFVITNYCEHIGTSLGH